MINEPTFNGFKPAAPLQNKPKIEESAEISRHVAEFLKKGGKITQVGDKNQLEKTGKFIVKEAAYTFDELPKVLEVMSKKWIKRQHLADGTNISKKLIDQFLSGKRIPDKIEKEKILAFLQV